jgi:LacI family transcriptional regulator
LARPVTIKDVARHAGVSVGTVSNVINHTDRVSRETRARVEAAIADLHFVRNESARQLRARQSRIVGILVLDITNPFFTEVARGVEDVLGPAGLSVVLCDSDTDEDRQDRYVQLLTEQRVQGVLVVPVGPMHRQVARLRRQGISVVLLDSEAPEGLACSVSVDDVGGGKSAVQHLLALGHRRIAFVGGKGRESQVADRAKGAQVALLQHDGPGAELVSVTARTLTIEGGFEAATQLLGMPESHRPTAAFCSNDLLALGLLRELTAQGVSVPEDFSIVGYDDIDFATAATVPLSSVRQPARNLGQLAGELLLEESSGVPHEHRQAVLGTELVVRASTAPPRQKVSRRARQP